MHLNKCVDNRDSLYFLSTYKLQFEKGKKIVQVSSDKIKTTG